MDAERVEEGCEGARDKLPSVVAAHADQLVTSRAVLSLSPGEIGLEVIERLCFSLHHCNPHEATVVVDDEEEVAPAAQCSDRKGAAYIDVNEVDRASSTATSLLRERQPVGFAE